MTELPTPPAAGPARAGTLPQRRSFATARVVAALILREMSSRYGKSALGYLWAVLEPLGGILVLAAGFSLLLTAPALGNSFLLFYASGFLPFNLYQNIQNTVSRAVMFNRPLLVYPAVSWMDAFLARFILNFLTSVLVTVILVSGILLLSDAEAVLRPGPIILSMVLSGLIGVGLGSVNATLFSLSPSWEQIWSIVTRPLFIASGVFFTFDSMPQAAKDVLWWNPLIHAVGLMRRGMYPTYPADYVSVSYVVFSSLICLLLGLILMGRFYRDIING